ncbi:PaaI family thioesterase [Nocardia sp. NPDC056541]|uniref:PaaI family thioesterase n=1 Tax=Nocardia sp. NPDC056541 TaxID=3345860 RepID=UPI00366E5D3A
MRVPEPARAATPDLAVRLPWEAVPDYHCFGCSPHNPAGLGLRFTAHPGGLRAGFRPTRSFESYPGVLHGGLVGVICDEVMANVIMFERGMPAFTVSMRTRYLTPLRVDHDYHCTATISRTDSAVITASAEIHDVDDELCASASATYRPFALGEVRHLLTLDDADVARLEHAMSTQNGVHP